MKDIKNFEIRSLIFIFNRMKGISSQECNDIRVRL